MKKTLFVVLFVILLSGLFLPAFSSLGKVKKDAAETLVSRILGKLGYTEEEAAAKFGNCLSFETQLAPVMISESDKRKPDYQQVEPLAADQPVEASPYLFVILFMILVKHTVAVRQLFQRSTVIGNAGEAGRGKAKGAFFQIDFFTDPVYDKSLILHYIHVCSFWFPALHQHLKPSL